MPLKTAQASLEALFCREWCSPFIWQLSERCHPRPEWSYWWVLSGLTAAHRCPRTKGINRELFGIFLYFTSCDLWSSCPPSQLGSDFCWGLAAAVSNRPLNIYMPLSSNLLLRVSGVRRWVDSLCAPLHNLCNIFTLNNANCASVHGLAQGLRGNKMQAWVQRDKLNNLICPEKSVWIMSDHPMVKKASCTLWRGYVVCSHWAGLFLLCLTWRCTH